MYVPSKKTWAANESQKPEKATTVELGAEWKECIILHGKCMKSHRKLGR